MGNIGPRPARRWCIAARGITRPFSWRWCRRAAALAAAAVVVTSCGGEDDGGGDAGTTVTSASDGVVTTEAVPSSVTSAPTTGAPTTTVAPTTATAPPTTRPAPNQPALASGLVEAVSPDDSRVLFADEDDELSQVGCEGLPAPVLFLAPVGGGDRVPAMGEGTTSGMAVRLATGQMAIIGGCEEFLVGIGVADEAPDGSLSAPAPTPLTGAPPVELVQDVEAAPEGTAVRILGSSISGSGPAQSIVEVDLSTGTATQLLTADGDLIAFASLADGRFALADGFDVRIVDATGTELASYPGEFVTAAPDGATLAVVGPGIDVVGPDGGTTSLPVAPDGSPPAIDAVWAPSGRALAFVARGTDDELSIVTTDGTVTPIDRSRRIVRVTFSPSGGVLAYTRLVEEGSSDRFEVVAVPLDPALQTRPA